MKKAIKKVASGLLRDADKSWFAELSDKGRTVAKYYPLIA